MSYLELFLYRPHPYQDGSFQIFMEHAQRDAEEHVADYILLDHAEEYALTERTVINICTLLNEEDELLDLRKMSENRLQFQIKGEDEHGWGRLILRTYEGDQGGNTKENALLRHDPEAIDILSIIGRVCGSRDGGIKMLPELTAMAGEQPTPDADLTMDNSI